MIRLSALIGAVVLFFATHSYASNADRPRGEIATVQDPFDTHDSRDSTKHASKPEANDAGADDSGSAWPQSTSVADEDPPNQGSPDDGPRQPKSGCSVNSDENDTQWSIVAACIAAYSLRRRCKMPKM